MTATPENAEGLLVIGHGTRDVQGVAEFNALSERLSDSLPGRVVEPAFLEWARPNIAEAVAAAVARGARQLVAMPLLLFSAGHVKRDIPLVLAEAAAAHPGLTIRQVGALECHPQLLELSALRFREALQAAGPHPADDTLLLFVGRGSHDPEANAEMARFARLRYEATPVAWHAVCFTAMARPSVEEALNRVAQLGFGRVVVQPHLLFQGELLARIATQVAAARRQHPRIGWLLTGHLGPDPLVARAVLAISSLTPDEALHVR